MAPPPTFRKDVIIQANLALEREAERAQKVADAAREAEELKVAAETAKRKHACLLMGKADAESAVWNERWKTEELVAKVRSIPFCACELFLMDKATTMTSNKLNLRFSTIEIAVRILANFSSTPSTH